MVVKEHITHLFFDLDHTIYDFDKNASLTFQAIFSDLNLKGLHDFMTHFKPINDYYWEKFANAEITHDELRYGRLKDTFTAVNISVADEVIYQIADAFIQQLPNHNHVFDGAHDTLNALKNNYSLHIITNGPNLVQERKLKNAGLTSYFSSITNSEKAGVKKPHLAIFEYALQAANANPKQSVMIGDSIYSDINGALNAGMQVVWFNEFNTENTLGVPEVNHLKQLLDIL